MSPSAWAIAALPKKGGLYEGSETRTERQERQSDLELQQRPPPETIHLQAEAGRLLQGRAKPERDLLLWYVQGRFISTTEAKIYLSLNTVCAGKGIHVVLKLRQ